MNFGAYHWPTAIVTGAVILALVGVIYFLSRAA